MGEVRVPFAFAKWMSGELSRQYQATLSPEIHGRLLVWQALAAATCPGHQFRQENQHRTCIHCGAIADYPDEVLLDELLATMGCHNCAYHEQGCWHLAVGEVQTARIKKEQAVNGRTCPFWEGLEGGPQPEALKKFTEALAQL